jgi:hypothetical protein
MVDPRLTVGGPGIRLGPGQMTSVQKSFSEQDVSPEIDVGRVF